MFQLWKLQVELSGMEAIFEGVSWSSQLFSLKVVGLPGLKISSHRCIYHLEGTAFPFPGGTSVSDGEAVKLLPWKEVVMS